MFSFISQKIPEIKMSFKNGLSLIFFGFYLQFKWYHQNKKHWSWNNNISLHRQPWKVYQIHFRHRPQIKKCERWFVYRTIHWDRWLERTKWPLQFPSDRTWRFLGMGRGERRMRKEICLWSWIAKGKRLLLKTALCQIFLFFIWTNQYYYSILFQPIREDKISSNSKHRDQSQDIETKK